MKWMYHYEFVLDGDFLRNLAKERNWFLCPYDILTGADIALFEDVGKRRDPDKRYIVCALSEVQRRMVRVRKGDSKEFEEVERYAITEFPMLSNSGYCADSYQEAISRWNRRTQISARRMLKPFPWRFFSMEYANMLGNAILWGILCFFLLTNNDVLHFYQDHSYFCWLVFLLVCSNAKNIFLKSYGEEIPGDILERWAGQHGVFFEEDFHAQAMAEWEFLREGHENSLPVYLMWKRGKLRSGRQSPIPVAPPAAEEPPKPEEPEEDRSHEDYCRQIKSLLADQLDEFRDYRTKIADKAVRKDIESIVGVLGEIQQVISSDGNTAAILLARPVVTYWNEKALSLLKSYVSLLNNSSEEAGATRKNIEEVLQEVQHVYRKELGRITEKNTFELNASIAVMREEIDQALRNRV